MLRWLAGRPVPAALAITGQRPATGLPAPCPVMGTLSVALWVVLGQATIAIYVVMPHGAISFYEEPLVAGVEHGSIRIWAGECYDVLDRVPDSDHGEFGVVIVAGPPQHQHGPVTGDVGVAGQGDFLHVFLVGVGVTGVGGAGPDPGNPLFLHCRRPARPV